MKLWRNVGYHSLLCTHLKNRVNWSAHILPDSERDKWGRLKSTRGGGCKCLISDLRGYWIIRVAMHDWLSFSQHPPGCLCLPASCFTSDLCIWLSFYFYLPLKHTLFISPPILLIYQVAHLLYFLLSVLSALFTSWATFPHYTHSVSSFFLWPLSSFLSEPHVLSVRSLQLNQNAQA